MRKTTNLTEDRARLTGAAGERFFELSLDPLCITGLDGVLRRVNPAFTEALGWTTTELESRSYEEFLHPDDRSRAAKALKARAHERSQSPNEYRWRCPNGSYRHLAFTSSAADEDGLFYSIARDLTDRRELEAQLRHARHIEAIGQLAGSVAHDLNNVLTVIQGCSEFLASSLAPDDACREDVDMIRDAAERAVPLTRQLLAMSRNPETEGAIVDVNACVADLQAPLRQIIRKDVLVATDLATDLGCVSADARQLEQVIINMAVNAQDAMPHGGELRLVTRPCIVDDAHVRRHPDAAPGPHVLLSITDNGHGVDPAPLDRIVEPLVTPKGSGAGKGLGLATAHAIVRQLNGHISVESASGAGTTFNVYLPVDAASNAMSRPDIVAETGGTETILLVEDDPSVRAVAWQMLTHHGYGVIEAANGAEALDTVRAWGGKVDLVITDAVMPVMNGGELAAALAAEYPHVKVLFMSLYTGDDIVKRGVDSKRAFMPKPFTTTSLTQKVRQVLDAPRSGS